MSVTGQGLTVEKGSTGEHLPCSQPCTRDAYAPSCLILTPILEEGRGAVSSPSQDRNDLPQSENLVASMGLLASMVMHFSIALPPRRVDCKLLASPTLPLTPSNSCLLLVIFGLFVPFLFSHKNFDFYWRSPK